jgi:hypothetical protein
MWRGLQQAKAPTGGTRHAANEATATEDALFHVTRVAGSLGVTSYCMCMHLSMCGISHTCLTRYLNLTVVSRSDLNTT